MLKVHHNCSRILLCSIVNGLRYSTRRFPKPHSTRKISPRPLASFFAQYTGFDYNPAKSATDEFYRLCISKGWNRNRTGKKKKKEAKRGFHDALAMQFNVYYGIDDDITNWQALCAKLKMEPVPENLQSCREAVRSKHVNLVDLVDNFSHRKKFCIFPTVVDLSKYTITNGKYFGQESAYAGNLLRYLLRHIKNPELERSRVKAENPMGTDAVVEAQDEDEDEDVPTTK